ncbi:MAG: alpha/beta hydrolase, partial [Limnobacter sp.]|nr:alpha/beta hydrolase [Limnobacter sp.]
LAVPVASLTMIAPAIRIVDLPGLPAVSMRLAYALSRTMGIGRWRELQEDIDFAKYESFPLNAGYQLFRLDEAIGDYDLSAVRVPVLVVMSEDDRTVDAKAAIALFRLLPTPSSAMLLVTRACRSDTVDNALRSRCEHGLLDVSNDPRIEFLPGILDGEEVLSFAHISFPSRPDNPHYGRHGDYASCLAYVDASARVGGAFPDKYCACITPAMLEALEARGRSCPASPARPGGEIRYGETLEGDRDRYVLRRLGYNPYFDAMTRRIRRFAGIEALQRAASGN